MPLARINNRLVLFVHIPKTGGTSVENTLATLGSLSIHAKPDSSWVPPQHWHAELYNLMIPRDFYDYGFMICRNPYLRLVSEFRHHSRRDEVAGLGFDAWARQVLEAYRTDNYVNYNHIRPQTEFQSSNIKVFRFEDGLQRAIDAVCAFCEVPSAAIRHDKASRRASVQVTPSTLKAIAAFYARDFDQFGYDPKALNALERSGVRIV